MSKQFQQLQVQRWNIQDGNRKSTTLYYQTTYYSSLVENRPLLPQHWTSQKERKKFIQHDLPWLGI
jgi:hypothetical protein